ncbi:MAG: sialate O-acetylesterase [Planctomycetota bacterium]
MKLHTCLLATLLLCACARAELVVAPFFGNHMVLQRDRPILVWGSAAPGQSVTVSLNDASATCRAADDGSWTARLDAMTAGGPYRMVVDAGEEQLRFGNVMLGDVWICSGQSNMGWRLDRTDRGAEFIATAENPNLRLFQVQRAWDHERLETVQTLGWRQCDGPRAARFSAVGYHFGRILSEETGVTIGMIESTWGGTPLEAWTPLTAIEANPVAFRKTLDSLADYRLPEAEAQRLLAAAEQKHIAFHDKAFAMDQGLRLGWDDPEFDDIEWDTVQLPGYVDAKVGALDGIVWLRRTVTLDPQLRGRPATLHLGRIDDYDVTIVNGTVVGDTLVHDGVGHRIERAYDIPADVLRAGENVIVIRLMDVRSAGGVTPDGRAFELRVADEAIPLEGAWRYQVGFNARDHGGFPRPGAYAVPIGRPFRGPAVLYNAMIHPIRKYGVSGFIWYQGESNSGGHTMYAEMFPAMITAWREVWANARGDRADGMPFYFVQLPNYRKNSDITGNSNWAELRDVQRRTLSRVPETGMAITIDVGDPADIHPGNKLPVAERLARCALIDVYGKSHDVRMGPTPTGAKPDGARVRIYLDDADGLRTTDGRDVRGFALAGADGVLHEAQARIDGPTLVVSSDAVTEPALVRYAWADNPDVNLVNAAALPASPFQLRLDRK